jgi:glycosyltransferase involved in cell wall biosynthesis
MKKVSCLLTVHNKESLIFDVCNGIKENISSSVDEIIVVLDGCTDSTESIVNQVFKDLKIIPLNHLIHFFNFKKPFYCFLNLQFGFANFFLVYYLFHLPQK